MATRFFTNKPVRNTRVIRPVSSSVFVWLAAVAVAGSVFSCFLMVGARQHFEAIQLGYQSEDLRRQAGAIEERLRKLNLEYARVTSPIELEKRAKDSGLALPKNAASPRAEKRANRGRAEAQNQPQNQPQNGTQTRIRAEVRGASPTGAGQ